ncbi:MAG TPA: c-type cytochrome [Pyrinomonadaceae bacterium]|jgi:hypothetical protein
MQRTTRALKLFAVGLALALVTLQLVYGPRAAAQTPPAPDAPVEQTRKNIQVLKGLPEAQLFPLMNFISASLGVRCGFCHVQTKDPQTGRDEWDWASDNNEHKGIARRMMQMTMSINKTNRIDVGPTGVTCYTCHHGSTSPSNLPALPLTASGHEPPAGPPGGGRPAAGNAPGGPPAAGGNAPGAAAPQGPPGAPGAAGPGGGARPARLTPEQVIDKYVAAVGGREAVAKVQTRVLKGTREASQNRNYPIEVTLKGADKFVVMATTPQGQVMQSYSGTSGWSKDPRGTHAATPEDLAAFKSTGAVYSLLQLTTPPQGARVGRGRVDERNANVLVYNPKPGVTERLFFDAETGLLLRRLTLTETVLNPIPEQVDFEDYRDVDGVKVPFTIRISNIDTFFSSTRKFTEIRHNVPVDDALFQMPAAAPKQ